MIESNVEERCGDHTSHTFVGMYRVRKSIDGPAGHGQAKLLKRQKKWKTQRRNLEKGALGSCVE